MGNLIAFGVNCMACWACGFGAIVLASTKGNRWMIMLLTFLFVLNLGCAIVNATIVKSRLKKGI